MAAEGGREPLDRRAAGDERAHPLRTEQPLLGGDGVQVRPEVVETERDGAGGLRPVDHHDRAPVVRELGDPGDRHDRPGRPQHVRDRDQPGPGRDRGIERGERPVVVAIVAGVDERDLDAVSVAQRVQRPDAAGVLVGGRHGASAGAPVGEQRRGVHRVGRRVGQARPRRRRVPRTAATPARASSMRAIDSRK